MPNPEDCHRDGYLRLSGGPSKQLPTNQRSPDWRSVPKSLALPIELTALTGLSLVVVRAPTPNAARSSLLDFDGRDRSDAAARCPICAPPTPTASGRCDQLGRAAGDGRLDVDELEERLQLAYAARTHAELERCSPIVGGAIQGAVAGGSGRGPAARRARVVRVGRRGHRRGSCRSWAATSARAAGASPSAATS